MTERRTQVNGDDGFLVFLKEKGGGKGEEHLRPDRETEWDGKEEKDCLPIFDIIFLCNACVRNAIHRYVVRRYFCSTSIAYTEGERKRSNFKTLCVIRVGYASDETFPQ